MRLNASLAQFLVHLVDCEKTMSRTMSEKEPELQNYGITPEEYALYKGEGSGYPYPPERFVFAGTIVIGLIVATFLIVVTQDAEAVVIVGGLSMIFGYLGVTAVGEAVLGRKWDRERARLLASPVASRIKLYEEARAAYSRDIEEAERAQRQAEMVRREAERARQEAERARQRKLEGYWMSLSGIEFERELGTLYGNLGYSVESTPRTGDQGIDLILRKNGRMTIVQCKRYQDPAGPAIARELYGSLIASGAHNAILACTAGFTQGVSEFVRGKPIALISVSDIVKMGERIQDKMQTGTASPPICPVQGCGKTMVTRTGRYGRFWGCLAFPKCRGTRGYQGP